MSSPRVLPFALPSPQQLPLPISHASRTWSPRSTPSLRASKRTPPRLTPHDVLRAVNSRVMDWLRTHNPQRHDAVVAHVGLVLRDWYPRICDHALRAYLRDETTVLVIGRDWFTRRDLAQAGCVDYIAAARLSRMLTRVAPVRDTRDLFTRYSPNTLPRIGVKTFRVLSAAFEIKGLSGNYGAISAWIRYHIPRDILRSFRPRPVRVHAVTPKESRRAKTASSR